MTHVATTVGDVSITMESRSEGYIVVELLGTRLVLSRAVARALVSMLRSALQIGAADVGPLRTD
jgi:hypothetical protein